MERTFRTEFPDYLPESLPAIPADWKDVSWRNEACPSFAFMEGAEGDSNHTLARVWIDYADATEREFPEMKRFNVTFEGGIGDSVPTLATDDWAEVLAYVEARKALANAYVEAIGYNPFLDDPTQSPAAVAEMLAEGDGAEFFPLADLDAWESFYAANADALADIGDKATCYALACNCSLIVGGGAAPLFRVGFLD